MEEINSLITEIEVGLKTQKIHTGDPQSCLDYYMKLSGWLSSAIGFQESLDKKEAEYYVNHRDGKKSDLAVRKDWKTTENGVKQEFWETRTKRIKVLNDALLVIYYAGRDEARLKTPL